MKRPLFLRAAPAIVAILTLTSMSASGASIRGGSTSTDNKAAAQGTAAHSRQQEGSVDSNATAQGAARRTRMGSFLGKTVEAVKKAAAPATTLISNITITQKDRELAAHIADVKAFVDHHWSPSVWEISKSTIANAKEVILNGPRTPEENKMFELVASLRTTNEEDLFFALLLIANHPNPLELRRPGQIDFLYFDRIEEKLRDYGLTHSNSVEGGWSLSRDAAAAAFATPGARAFLKERNVRRDFIEKERMEKERVAFANQRANLLSVRKAQQSLETMEILRTYFYSTYGQNSMETNDSKYFMNDLNLRSDVSANGGVVLTIGENPYEISVATAYGKITYKKPAYPLSNSHRTVFYAKLKADLGLEPLEAKSIYETSVNSSQRKFIVTRLPNGTKLPKATLFEIAPVSTKELMQTILKIPEKVVEWVGAITPPK